jgi:NAD(P)-dependent dehydrogenase (short-subunit alcohol dehydrogenase family)
MKGKTVVLTGGTSGIGKATALQLANKGARVIIGARDMSLAAEVVTEIASGSGNLEVQAEFVDLSSLLSVRRFAERISEQETGGVHILLNNAAGLFSSSVSSTSSPSSPKHTWSGLDPGLAPTTWPIEPSQLVNHLSHLYLSMQLQPALLRAAATTKAKEARVINVGSRLEKNGVPPDGIRALVDSASSSQQPSSSSSSSRSPHGNALSELTSWMRLGTQPRQPMKSYAESKFCMLAAGTRSLSHRWHGQGLSRSSSGSGSGSGSCSGSDSDSVGMVTVNCVSPGMVNTGLASRHGFLKVSKGRLGPT